MKERITITIDKKINEEFEKEINKIEKKHKLNVNRSSLIETMIGDWIIRSRKNE